ncbi:hypothetical protein LCGC14_1391230, partial [marine sediment metagenome]
DIFVPTHAGINLTVACVNSLYQFTKAPFHLIFMDDAPAADYGLTEQYVTEMQKTHNNITYIRSNIPWKCGNTFFNAALRYSKTPITVTCMNSMTVVPGWETTALRLMEDDPLIGSIGFKCLFPSGLIESAGLVFVGNLPTDYGRDLPGHWCTEIRDAECVQWAFAMHRRRALEGNLPEDIYNGHVGWDDIDNNFILKSKGWKMVYCGQGSGVHQPRATRGSNSVEAHNKNQENGRTFYKRWGLWDQFIEGSKMDVRNTLKYETKAELSTQVNKILVLQQLVREAEAAIQPLVINALAELKVDPDKYLLEMNPATDTWLLKLNSELVAESLAEAPVVSDNRHETPEKTIEAVKT